MKKLYILFALLLSLVTFAQAPEGFNYQATVRNSVGTLITNKNVDFTFKIIKDSPTGTAVYSETRTVTTDDLGAVSLVVGQGTPTAGTFSAIDWSNGTYYLGIELNTGSGNVAMGTTQLLSVPFALYAKTAGSTQNLGRVTISITGNISNEEAAKQIAEEFGPLTENIYIVNTTGLTTVDLSLLTKAQNIKIRNNSDLAVVDLNGVKFINELKIELNPKLKDFNANSLKELAVGLTLGYQKDLPSLTSLNLPQLSSGIVSIYYSPLLTSLSLPKLVEGYVYVYNTPLTYLNLPLFTKGNVYVYYTSLTSLSLPLFAEGMFNVSSNKSLTVIDIPSFATAKRYNEGYSPFNASHNSLSSLEINKILNILNTKVTFKDNNVTVYLENQTPSASPTGQGLIDKQGLISKGISVLTDY